MWRFGADGQVAGLLLSARCSRAVWWEILSAFGCPLHPPRLSWGKVNPLLCHLTTILLSAIQSRLKWEARHTRTEENWRMGSCKKHRVAWDTFHSMAPIEWDAIWIWQNVKSVRNVPHLQHFSWEESKSVTYHIHKAKNESLGGFIKSS